MYAFSSFRLQVQFRYTLIKKEVNLLQKLNLIVQVPQLGRYFHVSQGCLQVKNLGRGVNICDNSVFIGDIWRLPPRDLLLLVIIKYLQNISYYLFHCASYSITKTMDLLFEFPQMIQNITILNLKSFPLFLFGGNKRKEFLSLIDSNLFC